MKVKEQKKKVEEKKIAEEKKKVEEKKTVDTTPRRPKDALPLFTDQQLRVMFSKYDTDGNGGINEKELLKWMLDMNKETKKDKPTKADARNIIKIHDDDGNKMLEFLEVKTWLKNGADLTASERQNLSKQSKHFRRAIKFLEQVTRNLEKEKQRVKDALQKKEDAKRKIEKLKEKDLPRLNKSNLKLYFTKYNTFPGGMGESIDANELFAWMTEINFLYPNDPPTKADALNIINLYDKDGDKELQYIELEQWLDGASDLTKEEREATMKQGLVFRHMVGFAENALKACDKGPPEPRLVKKAPPTTKLSDMTGNNKSTTVNGTPSLSPSEKTKVTSGMATIDRRPTLHHTHSGLPPLNKINLKQYYNKYDADGSKGIDEQELLKWMLEVRVDADDAPTLEDARNIIEVHDDNGDKLLQYAELEEWIDSGARLSPEQRKKVAAKGVLYRHSIAFLEQVTYASTVPLHHKWKLTLGGIQMLNFSSSNRKKENSIVILFNGLEVLRSTHITGKLNPKWTKDFHCLVSIPNQYEKKHSFEFSSMKIVVLGADDIVLGSREYAGKELEEFVTHRGDGSGIWTPEATSLTLNECIDPIAEIKTWIWMKKLQPQDQKKLMELERIQEIEAQKTQKKKEKKKALVDSKKEIAKAKRAAKLKKEKSRQRRKEKALSGATVVTTKRENKKEEIAKRKQDKRDAQEKADTSLFQKKRTKKITKEQPVQQPKKKKKKQFSTMSDEDKKRYHTKQREHASRLHGRNAPTGKSGRRSRSPTQHDKMKASLKEKNNKKKEIKKTVDLSYLDRLSAGKTPTAKKLRPKSPPPTPKSKALQNPKSKTTTTKAPSNYEKLQTERKLRKEQQKEAERGARGKKSKKTKMAGHNTSIPHKKRFKATLKEQEEMENEENRIAYALDHKNDGKSMLPEININNLKHAFSQYDNDGNLSIDAKELLKWMIFMHQRDAKLVVQNTKENKKSTLSPGIGVAKYIVGLHDDSGDGLLQYDELEQWFLRGRKQWNEANIEERAKFLDRGPKYVQSIDFLERVVTWSANIAEDVWLPPLHRQNLKRMFDQHTKGQKKDQSEENELTPACLHQWMISITASNNDNDNNNDHEEEPPLDVATKIIGIHDKDQNGSMSYQELELWIAGGAYLPKAERDAFSRTSRINKYAVAFLENVVHICALDQQEFFSHLQNPKEAKERASKRPGKQLPPLHEQHLRRGFLQYDIDETLQMNTNELYRWMTFMYENGIKKGNKTSKKKDQPTKEDASDLLSKLDNTGDGTLEYEEIFKWFQQGHQMWNQASLGQRARFEQSTTDSIRRSMDFLINVVSWASRMKKSEWLPRLHRENMKQIFREHSETKESLVEEELLAWMLELHVLAKRDSKSKPTLATARQIILIHDDDKDGKMQYIELQKWIASGCNLPQTERETFAKTSEINRHSVNFLEDLVHSCANMIQQERKLGEILVQTKRTRPADMKRIEKLAKPRSNEQKKKKRSRSPIVPVNITKTRAPVASIPRASRFKPLKKEGPLLESSSEEEPESEDEDEEADEGEGGEKGKKTKKKSPSKTKKKKGSSKHRKADMTHISKLAQPRILSKHPIEMDEEEENKVGSRESHTEESIQKEIQRLQQWNDMKNRNIKRRHKEKEEAIKEHEWEHCTFQPVLNKYDWKEKVKLEIGSNYQRQSLSPPPTVTVGRYAPIPPPRRTRLTRQKNKNKNAPLLPARNNSGGSDGNGGGRNGRGGKKNKNKTPPSLPARSSPRSQSVLRQAKLTNEDIYANGSPPSLPNRPDPGVMVIDLDEATQIQRHHQQQHQQQHEQRGRIRTRDKKKTGRDRSPHSPGFDFDVPAKSLSPKLPQQDGWDIMEDEESAIAQALLNNSPSSFLPSSMSIAQQQQRERQEDGPPLPPRHRQVKVQQRVTVMTPPVRPRANSSLSSDTGLQNSPSPRERRVRYTDGGMQNVQSRQEDHYHYATGGQRPPPPPVPQRNKRTNGKGKSRRNGEGASFTTTQQQQQQQQQQIPPKRDNNMNNDYNNDDEIVNSQEYYDDAGQSLSISVARKGDSRGPRGRVPPPLDEEERFDFILHRANRQARQAARDRVAAEEELLRVEAEDIRLTTSMNKAGEVMHRITTNGDAKRTSASSTSARLHRYETTLANHLTDKRPPHARPHDGLGTSRTRESIIRQHPIYSKKVQQGGGEQGGRGGRGGRGERGSGPKKQSFDIYGDLDPKARTGRGTSSMPKLAKTGSFFMDHVENSNRRLERMVTEGWGRIELLQQLEFELLRNEFDSSFSSMESQISEVRRAERDRKNVMIVKERRRREAVAADLHRQKRGAMKKKRPPKRTLTHARDELSLLKTGRMVPMSDIRQDRKSGRTARQRKKQALVKTNKNEGKSDFY